MAHVYFLFCVILYYQVHFSGLSTSLEKNDPYILLGILCKFVLPSSFLSSSTFFISGWTGFSFFRLVLLIFVIIGIFIFFIHVWATAWSAKIDHCNGLKRLIPNRLIKSWARGMIMFAMVLTVFKKSKIKFHIKIAGDNFTLKLIFLKVW